MLVYKNIEPLKAYAFISTADGNNFSELAEAVANDGGSIVSKGDDFVLVKTEAGEFTLPIGYALVIDGGVGKLISYESFKTSFTPASSVNVDIQNSITELKDMVETRLKAVETKVETMSQSKTAAKKSA